MNLVCIYLRCLLLIYLSNVVVLGGITIENRVEEAKLVLKQALQSDDLSKIAESYYILGKRQKEALQLEEAYASYYNALTFFKRLENHYFIGKTYLRLAGLEIDQRNLERAREYIFEALKIFQEHQIKNGVLSCYDLMGRLYIVLQELEVEEKNKSILLDSSLSYSLKGELLATELGDENRRAALRFNIGKVYLQRKDPKAIEYLEYAAQIQRKKMPTTEQIIVLTELASAWLYFNNPTKANKILDECKLIIEKDPLITLAEKAKHYVVCSQYYKQVKNWQEAYNYREMASVIFDRIAHTERNEHISKWRIRLETEKKELELQLRTNEIQTQGELIRQQRYIITIIAVSLLVVALLCYFLYRNFKKQQSLSRKNAFLVQEQSHRVKNNLQVISSLLHLQEDYVEDTVAQEVLAESQTRINAMILLHSQLYQSSVEEHIDIEELFMAIIESVAATFGVEYFESTCEMDIIQLDPDLATSVGVIFNELVINSFKHGYTTQQPRIEVKSVQKEDQILITYTDFGEIDFGGVFENSDRRGFGLQLIDMLLFQIDGKIHYNFDQYSTITITFKNRFL